jgi:hypothetical protein
MASAVHIATSPTCTDVLREPFDNLTAWTYPSFPPPIVPGRTGTAISVQSNAQPVLYTIPLAKESDTITVGFALKISSLAQYTDCIDLGTDSSGTFETRQNTLRINTDGSVAFQRDVSVLQATAAGVIAINTWYYIEIQAKLHDTVGFFTVRINGVTVLSGTNVDTRYFSTKTTYDRIRLAGISTGTTDTWFDDLYLTTGSGCAFQGDQAIVNTGPDVLLEPFNNLTAWTAGGSPTIVAGRTGTGGQLTGTQTLTFNLTALQESDTVTIGFAFRCTAVTGAVGWMSLRSDAAATIHSALTLSGTGVLALTRGSGGLQMAASSPGAIAINTWYYIEIQVKLSDTVGTAILRINGVPASGTFSGDTKNAGTKTTFDSVRIGGSAALGTATYDDLYVSVGVGAPFKGDITIP